MIAVTGANGFVGRMLCDQLEKKGHSVRRLVRRSSSNSSSEFEIGDIGKETDFTKALIDVSIVIHCAARVHVMNEAVDDSIDEYSRVNSLATLRLAQEAYNAGVKRFIFLSSIKVNGEFTKLGHPCTPEVLTCPKDYYGASKYEAEVGLMALAKETGMEVVIIRPPLVYGPGVSANFLSMMIWLSRGLPLPLGGITKNRRSLVYIDNLIDLIIVCITHAKASNQIFLVSDDEDLSTTELLERMAQAMGLPSQLIPIPVPLVFFITKLIGRSDMYNRLCNSLQIDLKKTKDVLGWSPPVSVEEGLRKTAEHFLIRPNC